MVPGRASFGAQNLGFTRCAKKSDTISSLIFPMYGDLLQDLGSLFTLWFGLLLARVGNSGRLTAAGAAVVHGENDGTKG